MPLERVEMFWQAIDVLEAQDILLKLKASDYPNLKPKAKRKALQFFEKRAYANIEHQPLQFMKSEDAAAILKTRLK